MPIKLHIKDTETKEILMNKVFSKDLVKIGRSKNNDVSFDEKYISGYHAGIIKKNNKYIIEDQGSKNGTFLNELRIGNKESFKLKDKDTIRICNYLISFSIVSEKKVPKEENSKDATAIKSFIDVEKEASEFAINLRLAYSENINELADKREVILKEEIEKLRKKIGHKSDLTDIISLAMIRFANKKKEQKKPPAIKKLPQNIEKVCLEELIELSNFFAMKNTEFQSEDDIIIFCERVKEVLNTTFSKLANTIQLYKEFQDQFDVASTKIFNLGKNPIKRAITAKNIGKYLLDCKAEPLEKVLGNYNDVHKDLMLHQMAVLKGFKKCLHELLMEFSPRIIEQEVGKRSRIGPVTKSKMWKRYVEKHTEISENETRTFNVIRGKFQQIYLATFKKKNAKNKIEPTQDK